MPQVITTEKAPIKLWLDDIEGSALDQAKNVANHPFTHDHVALMPDAHFGYGVPIGCVWATKGVVSPAAVGVDIGCGVCAVQTPWFVEDIGTDRLKKIMGEIRKAVPAGFSHNKEPQDEWMPDLSATKEIYPPQKMVVVEAQYESARFQLGTLGGGNHFIEIQADEKDQVWVMIHSGSRNLGLQVAKVYGKLAASLSKELGMGIPAAWKLDCLKVEDSTRFGKQYLAEMQYCVDFALANRRLMMHRICDVFDKAMSWKKIDRDGFINIAHNYAIKDPSLGSDVFVHRKGATSANLGEIGIIPGSQGSCSYIVCGKGNPDSYQSCSHGAGRKLGRKAAQRTLDLAEEQKRLDDLGIIHGIRNKSDLDEAAGAYKDIDEVMANQKDLVSIEVKLRPLAVIKG